MSDGKLDEEDEDGDVPSAIAELMHEVIEFLKGQEDRKAILLQGKLEFALAHWFELDEDEESSSADPDEPDEDEDEDDDEDPDEVGDEG